MRNPQVPRFGVLFFVLGAAIGCGSPPSSLAHVEEPPAPSPQLGAAFEPRLTGTIVGKVCWEGPLPEIHSFLDAKVSTPIHARWADSKNPLAPKIHRDGNGLQGAVVFLRHVDPARSKPWDLGAVRVEINDGQITVNQGESGPQVVGFVHRGDQVEMVSHTKTLEILRARGDAFFTLPFPEPEKPLSRPLAKRGLVELTGAAGNYWARSYLFVAEHPYYALSGVDGRFRLENVPEGEYDVVCWIPNWKVDRFERDPENLNIARLWGRPPVVWVAERFRVAAGAKDEITFSVKEADFSGTKK